MLLGLRSAFGPRQHLAPATVSTRSALRGTGGEAWTARAARPRIGPAGRNYSLLHATRAPITHSTLVTLLLSLYHSSTVSLSLYVSP